MFSKINTPSSFVILPLTILLSTAFNKASGQNETPFVLASIIFPSSLFCACEVKKEKIRKGISKLFFRKMCLVV
jgi:hypothetical protein